MTGYVWWHFMNLIGFRRVLYLPSQKGLSMADFHAWEYAPRLEKRDYTENDFPFQMYWGK
jgi:hypothetical protein